MYRDVGHVRIIRAITRTVVAGVQYIGITYPRVSSSLLSRVSIHSSEYLYTLVILNYYDFTNGLRGTLIPVNDGRIVRIVTPNHSLTCKVNLLTLTKCRDTQPYLMEKRVPSSIKLMKTGTNKIGTKTSLGTM